MTEHLKVLITVKTFPIPSAKYDELVCTAGVNERGDFLRLYPINFRDLPQRQRYQKYQWIEVDAEKHTKPDSRKESYRPKCETIQLVGEPLPSKHNWAERSRYVLAKASRSIEELQAKQAADRTSLGIFRPKEVIDLVVRQTEPDWKPSSRANTAQNRLWETRKASREPLPKLPFKFQYRFTCDDARCNGHQMMVEDWEVGALYSRCVGSGATPTEACSAVRQTFFDKLCAPDRDTHFYVGTIAAHPKSWVVIGVYWPPKVATTATSSQPGLLFD
jgi:hypothetical protein